MKTVHMTINEKTATITVTSVEELTQAEWNLFNSLKDLNYKVKNKRKKSKNAMHKKQYYLERLQDDEAALRHFEMMVKDDCFARAVKWYRDVYEPKKLAEKQHENDATPNIIEVQKIA